MSFGTRMFLAKSAAVAKCRAGLPTTVTVLFGGKVQSPSAGFTADQVVSFGNIRFTRTVATMDDFLPGVPGEDESFSIDVVIECTVVGTDQAAATKAACDVFDAVDALFRTRDETIGVPGVQYARLIADGQVTEATDARTVAVGRSAVITAQLQVLGLI